MIFMSEEGNNSNDSFKWVKLLVKYPHYTVEKYYKEYQVIRCEPNKEHLNYIDRLGKGEILEALTKDTFTSLGWIVDKHKILEGGADVTAKSDNFTIKCQCWNWWGGYPYPERWSSTISKLDADINILIAYGVKPTSQQYLEAEAKNIHIIHYPKQLNADNFDKPSIVNWFKLQIQNILSAMGVITVNTIIDNSVNQSSYLILEVFLILNLVVFLAGLRV